VTAVAEEQAPEPLAKVGVEAAAMAVTQAVVVMAVAEMVQA